jgi:PAS domain S-box-containing protein
VQWGWGGRRCDVPGRLDVDIQRNAQGLAGRRWSEAVTTGLLTAGAYFLAARLSLVLLAELEGVAVFWPASGVAVGILMALGPSARAPVAIGVVFATVGANLLGDRNLWASLFSGFCNAGGAMLTAWLIGRWFGQPFRLDTLARVLGFLLAATIGAAVTAAGGAVTMRLFHTTAPMLGIWQVWFTSDGLGVITIAPLLIGLAQVLREPRPRRELAEGAAALVILAIASGLILALPPGLWATVLPAALLFPQLLWLAARCPPVYPAAAAFMVAFAIVWATSFGIGYFGDPDIPIDVRMLGAQISMLAATVCSLVLTALFADMRRHEAALEDSNERLELALNGAELGAFSADIATGRFKGDARVGRQHGHQVPPETIAEVRRFVDPADLARVDRAFATAPPGGACRAEYRVTYPPDHPQAGEVRWIAVEGTVVRNRQGRAIRLLGVTRDITKDRIVEDRQRKRELAFRELLGALPAAVYTTDAAGRITFFNRAAADIWGSCPRLGCARWGGAWPLFHLDGTPIADEDSPLALSLRADRPIRGIEVIGERADGTRVHFIPYPTPLHDESGALLGAVNMLIDITELKRTEAALRDSETRLRQALTAGRVIAFEWEPRTGLSQRSDNAVEILGWDPAQEDDGLRNSFLARVHPEDRAGFKAHVYGVSPGKPAYSAIFRFLHPDGHVVWLEETAEGEFDAGGRFVRLKGVTRDVSERKRAEERQSLLVAELDHRVKNVLACVSAVAQRGREGNPSIGNFLRELDGRILSMANAHALLSRGRWLGVQLGDLVRRELAPWVGEGNAIIEGPDIVLTADATQSLAMVLHELATNAAKYGALSTPSGRVCVHWDRHVNGIAPAGLVVKWREMDGPLVAVPSRSGYGTSVIADLIPYELGGAVDMCFAADGMRCTIAIPLKWIANDRPDFLPSGPSLPASPAAAWPAAPRR